METRKTELKPLKSDPEELIADISPPSPSPLSIEPGSRSYRVNHWRNHPYAVGLVEPTWADEMNRSIHSDCDSDMEANGPNREPCSDATNAEMDPTCGCLAVSGYVCGRLGYKRIGNMVILKERAVDDKSGKTEFEYIIGPYWPMLFFVTYPLILGKLFLRFVMYVLKLVYHTATYLVDDLKLTVVDSPVS